MHFCAQTNLRDVVVSTLQFCSQAGKAIICHRNLTGAIKTNKQNKPKTKQNPTQPKTKPTCLHLHAHNLTGKYACNQATISSELQQQSMVPEIPCKLGRASGF